MLSTRNTIKLTHPFEHEGQIYSELELRRPKVRDLKALASGKGGAFERMERLIADLAEIPPAAISEIDTEDFQAVQDWLAPLLGKDESPNDQAVRDIVKEMMAGS